MCLHAESAQGAGRGARGGGHDGRGARSARRGGAPGPRGRRAARASGARACRARQSAGGRRVSDGRDGGRRSPAAVHGGGDSAARGRRPKRGWRSCAGCSSSIRTVGKKWRFSAGPIAEQAPETGFAVVELAADAAVAGQDWASAAAALQEFVTRVPNHIPALDASGRDLRRWRARGDDVQRAGPSGRRLSSPADRPRRRASSPKIWSRASRGIARTWSVSAARSSCSGEPDPEALIAERLSGQSPFMTTDLFLESHEFPSARRARRSAGR